MDFAEARTRLIKYLSRDISDKRVLEVMEHIPRELFVPEDLKIYAYEDRPLPIGYDQTISQPYIIALMTSALELTGTENVLEVGTGSGYQAAILAELAAHVVTTERIPELAEKARKVLTDLGYRNVEVHLSKKDVLGWPEKSPYDAIIVTAGAPNIPDELLNQLNTGGKMVIPVGSRYLQELCKITRLPEKNKIENLGGCHFVPLIGRGAWQSDNNQADTY